MVSGIGMVTPLGLGREKTWKRLLDGESGVGRITRFDPEPFACQVAGEVVDAVPPVFVDHGDSQHYRVIDYAAAAVEEALTDADVHLDAQGASAGLVVGTHGVALSAAELVAETSCAPASRKSLQDVHAIGFVPRSLATRFGTGGPVISVTTACSSGAIALVEGIRLLASGDHSMVVAGGTDAALSEYQIMSFLALGALSVHNDDPPTASRPFDRSRAGFVLAEGACFMVLERETDVARRGGHSYGAITGWGVKNATNHMTASTSEGAFQLASMRASLDRSGRTLADLDYVNAHGTGTQDNDRAESRAIRTMLGSGSDALVSSTKGATGHLLAAAGAVEAAFCLLTMRDSVVLPTRNLRHIDPQCELHHVQSEPQKQEVKVALSNSFGLGGSNVSLVIEAA